jgi:hypothetical protein
MTLKLQRVSAMALAFVTTAALAATAQAQDVEAGGQAGRTLPGAGAPRAAAIAGDSDHDMQAGNLGVGYLGRRSMFTGVTGGATGTIGASGVIEVAAPVIGIRYWVDDFLGIDAGLGVGIQNESGNAGMGDADGPNTSAFIIHAGVPLSLSDEGHFSFQIVPELNVGFASFSADVDQEGNGFHLDVGARAGAEIHFGFIGIPKLSLQGSVGVFFASDSVSSNGGGGAPDLEGSRWALGTSVYDNPWNIFQSNVAALYYF